MWKISGILLIWSMLAFACNLDQEKDPIIVPVVEDEFYLDLWQVFSPAGVNLVVEFETLTDEDCLNAEVLSVYERTADNLRLSLYEILQPEVCEAGEAPARGQERFTALENGTYELLIELQEVVQNEGILSVDDTGFAIETETNGFQWRHGRIERMPANALWGYISYTNEDEKTIAQQELAELQTFTSNPEWTSGYYGYFTLQEAGDFVLAERLLPVETEVLPFVVNLTDAAALEEWLDNMEAQLAETMSLHVYAGTGESWEL